VFRLAVVIIFLAVSPASQADGDAVFAATPEEILNLRAAYEARNGAINSIKKHKVKRRFVGVTDSLSNETPVVSLLFRNPSVLFFIDAAGAKWPVTKVSIINDDWLKCANCEEDSGVFDNSIEIYSSTSEGEAYFNVYLEDRPMPILIRAISSNKYREYHAVTDIGVGDLKSSDNVTYGAAPLVEGKAPDQDLSNALANVAPRDSFEVRTSSEHFTVWRQGDTLIVRTKMRIASPQSARRQKNSTGDIAYRLVGPASSRILAYTDDGKSLAVKVFLDD
jgi:hypothetical protein